MAVMLVLVLCLVALLGVGFYMHVQTLIASAPKPTPATVSTMIAAPSQWQPRLTAVGSVSAVNGVDVASQEAGVVSEIPVSSGATVEAGTVLAKLDVEPDMALLASLRAAADLSEVTYQRDTRLLPQNNSVSQSTVDADAADLKSRRALVAQQEALIERKTIRAPFAGELGIVEISLGQYLTPGTVIATLQDLSSVHVDFLVPQDQLGNLKIGQTVSVTSDTSPDRSQEGTLTALSPRVDPDTRNATVRAELANPQRLLRPGMFVRVAVSTGAPRSLLTLPVTVISYNSYGSIAYVLKPAPQGEGKIASQVFVTTGDRRGDQVAVLTGIDAGQEVVTAGQLKLADGAPVTVDNSVAVPNAPNPAPQEG